MLIAALFVFLITAGSGRAYENEEFLSNITRTLNGILSETYDTRIRPDVGGPPIKVSVNMYVKSLGPISENDGLYMMDVYFRQSWYDNRLGFSVPGKEEFTMSWLFLEKIWKPDTFFLNGAKSHLHRMTSPNKFVRLRKDGLLTYSMRLTVSARCQMFLRKFPLDSQICPLVIGSYGYLANDIIYEWDEKGVTLEKGISDAQYEILNVTTVNNQMVMRGTEQFSVVSAHFFFRRSIGYYVLQIYVPCTLIVFCSWISFWITPGDSSGRISLGVTTVLSITTLGFSDRSKLPKVSYVTALDWYIIICFAFAFMVMIEYAAINFLDKLAADIKKVLEEEAAAKLAAEEAARLAEEKNAEDSITKENGIGIDIEMQQVDFPSPEPAVKKPTVFGPRRWCSVPSDLSKQADRISALWVRPLSATNQSGSSASLQAWYKNLLLVVTRLSKSIHRITDLNPKKDSSKIDIFARRIFPSCFSVMVFTYAMLYNYYITDMTHELDLSAVNL